LALHVATYRARPDVTAIIHLHPQSVLLLDAVGRPIRLATTDHVFYLRNVVTVPFAPPGTVSLGELAAEAARASHGNVFVLSRHGCSVLADSIELAHKRALYLEEAAMLTYRAAVLHAEPRALPAEWIAHVEKSEQNSV
jgi:L-fuculose-phosphate aldolase